MGPDLVLSLFSFDRTAEAMEIADLLFSSKEISGRIRPDKLAQLYSALAAAQEPIMEIIYTPGEGTIDVVDPTGLLNQKDPAVPEGSSLLIEVRYPGYRGHADTLIIGNRGLNELVRLLASAPDPEHRLRLLAAVAHVEGRVLADIRPERDSVSTGLLRTTQDLATTAV
ncbi:MAG: hypothetical protein LC799_15355, partial [Actinobacteria bacterium]|nr:hypothetical protein [Actinomycetota bacterium]